jgi:hypothetical protein
MNEHTPGPWTVTDAVADDGELLFHEIRADRKTLASTWARPHIANARLIAAAPELLAVLERICAIGAPLVPPTRLIYEGRAAIAKATGGGT